MDRVSQWHLGPRLPHLTTCKNRAHAILILQALVGQLYGTRIQERMRALAVPYLRNPNDNTLETQILPLVAKPTYLFTCSSSLQSGRKYAYLEETRTDVTCKIAGPHIKEF